MRVLIIGLGSMGKRRIRLIKRVFSQCEIAGVDTREDRRNECENVYQIKTYVTLEEALQSNYDCAFVCTAPIAHAAITRECLKCKLHVFSEINLISDGYIENIDLAQREERVLFLSSTPLYRKEIECIEAVVLQQSIPLHYIYHVGQYLSDWHPWENIQNFFVGDRRTNGCREIMAIEFPWIVQIFGDIDGVSVLADNITKLPIDYKDSYLLRYVICFFC